MIESEPKIETKVGFFSIIRRLWPSFVIYNSFAFTVSTIFINLLIVSNIIWSDGIFHSGEMGLLVGISTYVTAFSGILFGMLADRYSRKLLMAITEIIFGLGFVLNAFVAQGLGSQTYIYFFVFDWYQFLLACHRQDI